MIPPILDIDNILVSSEIINECFCCDYQKCKGACCIIGDSGAPLTEKESSLLERNYPKFKEWMTPEGIEKIERDGFFEIDIDGDMVTPLLGNSEECAYTLFEEENCLCSIERAHIKGNCSFVKPISCRLYPIRASILANGMTALNLHRWDICSDAFRKGKKEGIPVYVFLKEPLIEAYGRKFYKHLCEAAELLASAD